MDSFTSSHPFDTVYLSNCSCESFNDAIYDYEYDRYSFWCSSDEFTLTIGLWPFFISLILNLLAITTNVLFLITVKRHPMLRKSAMSIYLVALSVVDLITSFLILVCSIIQLIFKLSDPIVTSRSAVLLSLCWSSLQYISLCLVILIAYERYKAICKPLEHIGSVTNLKRRCCLTAIGIFVAFGVLFVVFLFSSMELLGGVRSLGKICEIPPSSYIFISSDLITLLIVVILYTKIIKVFNENQNISDWDNIRKRNHELQRNLTIMVLVNSAVFIFLVLCQDIAIFLAITVKRDDGGLSWEDYLLLIFFPSLLNSGINPVIYNIFGSRYRSALKSTVLNCCTGRDQNLEHGDIELSHVV
ncbi:uncharacterized protein [Apostichopus japonicus]|uniref:uncharacterized protein n=1 Tax=Stichopus japonicus TaxID=307972 RepID=UPI003AB7923A